MKGKHAGFWLIFCSALVCMSSILSIWIRFHHIKPVSAFYADAPVIVIDAGHGGIDGGAVSAEGALEKEINLSIAQKLNDMLTVFGFRTVMIRDSDRSIHDPSVKGVKSQKTSDLKNRLKILEDTPSGIWISIHQNKYSDSAVSGTQVFYGPNRGESAQLANYLQRTVTGYLQPDNTRETKAATDSLYILYHASKPAVMVECGFLSNPQEARLLQDDTYQNKLSFSIVIGLMNTLAHQENRKG